MYGILEEWRKTVKNATLSTMPQYFFYFIFYFKQTVSDWILTVWRQKEWSRLDHISLLVPLDLGSLNLKASQTFQIVHITCGTVHKAPKSLAVCGSISDFFFCDTNMVNYLTKIKDRAFS